MTDPRMRGFRTRHDVSEVVALLANRIRALPSERCSAFESAGRVLSAAVTAPVSVPVFARAAMDGYAVVAEDTFGATDFDPVELEILGDARPGRPAREQVRAGTAIRIMTGSPIPVGADAVVMAEYTEDRGAVVAVRGAVTPGRHVGRIGEDIEVGQVLLPSGRILRPQDLGVLASVGVSEVELVRRPIVDIVITGSELLPAGSRPEGFRSVDASSPMLGALVQRDGGTIARTTLLDDDRAAIGAWIDASTADVLLITGGSSVGLEDHVPGLIRERGSLEVHGVAMRPSSPTGVGFLGERPVFLLPGNPVSTLCAYEFFAGPTIRALGGRSREWPHPTTRLPLREKISSEAGRVDYVRVRIEKGEVVPLLVSGASILSSTTRADGVVIVDQDLEGIPAGEQVTVRRYD